MTAIPRGTPNRYAAINPDPGPHDDGILRWMRLHPDARIDPPAHPGDVGFNLTVVEATAIPKRGVVDVPLGVAIEPPPGTWVYICGRSSALNRGILVHTGVIDNGYRGPLYARVMATGRETHVEAGAQIAQLIVLPAIVPESQQTPRLQQTYRGTDGFGSTGK